MGRRIFFLLAVTLPGVWSPARVLGQGPRAAVGAIDPAPFPTPAADFPEPEPLSPPAQEPAAPAGQKPDAPSVRAGHSAELAPEIVDEAAPKRDEDVERTQAAPAAAPAAAVNDGGEFLQPLDRLKLGKHEVLLSVNVLAPADMNINKESMMKIVVKNDGSADALGVVVRDVLPPGLAFVSSSPEPLAKTESLLTWKVGVLLAGTEKAILVKVKPTQAAPMDHAATVTFQAGSRAHSRVLQPKLRVEVVQSPSINKVLKGKSAEFRISVTNTGDGPARDVVVLAKLSPGLSHESGEKNEDNSFDLPLREINAGQRVDLPVMVVDANQGGQQSCLVKATSPDVVFDPAEAQIEKALEVIEPRLKLTLVAPEKRYTDTIATYTLTVENPGTAPAKDVRLLASLPVSGKLVSPPPDARYDAATRRITWAIPQLDPGEKPRSFTFEVKMGGIGFYIVTAEAKADNAIFERADARTDVQGMADLDLVVRESRRVVDVDGTTTFQVRLRNYGSKDASNVKIRAEVSPNLQIIETAGGPPQPAEGSPDHTKAAFPLIDHIKPSKEIFLQVKVKVVDPKERAGTCRVFVSHDDLSQELEDMALVKVAESRRTASSREPAAPK